jgi:hypothetical protein
MRFTLIDLIIITSCVFGGVLAVNGAGPVLGYVSSSPASFWLGIPVGALFYLVLTPPFYQRFSLLPLFLVSNTFRGCHFYSLVGASL